MLSMYPDEVELPEGEEVQRTYDAMLTAVSDDSWDGDLDAWPEALDVGVIHRLPLITRSAWGVGAHTLQVVVFLVLGRDSKRQTSL